jgi:hypothetical protein
MTQESLIPGSSVISSDSLWRVFRLSKFTNYLPLHVTWTTSGRFCFLLQQNLRSLLTTDMQFTYRVQWMHRNDHEKTQLFKCASQQERPKNLKRENSLLKRHSFFECKSMASPKSTAQEACQTNLENLYWDLEGKGCWSSEARLLLLSYHLSREGNQCQVHTLEGRMNSSYLLVRVGGETLFPSSLTGQRRSRQYLVCQ